jgi:hypothetical protein
MCSPPFWTTSSLRTMRAGEIEIPRMLLTLAFIFRKLPKSKTSSLKIVSLLKFFNVYVGVLAMIVIPT